MALPESVIQVQALTRRYGASTAISKLDFVVRPGERFGIIGPDGAGKTTLLQMLAGILDPTEGTCRVLDFDSRQQSHRIAERIGYMSQGFTLYDRLSVDENLEFAATIRNVQPGDFQQRRAALLEMAGLERFTGRRAGKLSGGMRKKLSLCTNLIHEPELLILDEPGLGVDPLSRSQLWQMLDQYRNRNITVVVATSYMDEAERCDRVMLLNEGKMLLNDRPSALRQSATGHVFETPIPESSETNDKIARVPGVKAVQRLPDRLRIVTGAASPGGEAFLPVASIRPVAATLDDLFVIHADTNGAMGITEHESVSLTITSAGISARNVDIRFGNFKAVDDVSLEAPAGELLALLGPNGAGKTTLIRGLCGLLPLSSGAATVAGTPVLRNSSKLRQRIGYMSQRFSLYQNLTPLENLEFFARAYGLAGQAGKRAIRWAQDVTALETLPDSMTAELSGATRQRLALACSILHHPSVLFLDEPTSGVDPVSRYRFWQLIRKLSARGMTAVVTTHYLDEAVYCDHLAMMMDGRLIAHGSADELRGAMNLSADADMGMLFETAMRLAGRDQMVEKSV